MRFEREVFQCRACRKSFAPADTEIGLESGENLDRAMTRNAALVGAMASFPHGSMMLKELTRVAVSPAEIHRTANKEGARADAFQRRKEERFLEPVSPWKDSPEPRRRPAKLVLEADATGVLTVAGEENKSVYCGTAFALEDRGSKNERPFLVDRCYTASAVDMDDFSQRLKALAWQAGMRQAAQTAFVGDGARCLWTWAEASMPRGTLFIQDFWHVAEHLADLAKDVFGEAGWREAYERWRTRLRKGKAQAIIKELRTLAASAKGRKRERLEEEITYLDAGKHRMDYPRYRREGWPIGSGAIEGTCKHLVKERFGVTGAQWRRDNIQNVLALRVTLFNGEWDEFYDKAA